MLTFWGMGHQEKAHVCRELFLGSFAQKIFLQRYAFWPAMFTIQ